MVERAVIDVMGMFNISKEMKITSLVFIVFRMSLVPQWKGEEQWRNK